MDWFWKIWPTFQVWLMERMWAFLSLGGHLNNNLERFVHQFFKNCEILRLLNFFRYFEKSFLCILRDAKHGYPHRKWKFCITLSLLIRYTQVRIVKMCKDQKDSMFCEIYEISSFIENFDFNSKQSISTGFVLANIHMKWCWRRCS